MEERFINVVFIIFLVIVAITVHECSCYFGDQKISENCECGGHYQYQQAVGHQYLTTYIYRCDKCGKIVEVFAKIPTGGRE